MQSDPTSPIPADLQQRAEATDEEPTEWKAGVPEGNGTKIYRWPLDPGCAFGSVHLMNWLVRIVARHGYPVRVQWRRKSGKLLHDQPIWGEDSDTIDGGSFAAMVPDASDLTGRGLDIETTPTTPGDKLINLLLTEPDLALNAFKTITKALGDAFRRDTRADLEMFAELIKLNQHNAAVQQKALESATTAAIESTLAELIVDAGYEVDEDNEIVDDAIDPLPRDDQEDAADKTDDAVDFVADQEADQVAELALVTVPASSSTPDEPPDVQPVTVTA